MALNLRSKQVSILGKMLTLGQSGVEDFSDQWKVLVYDNDLTNSADFS